MELSERLDTIREKIRVATRGQWTPSASATQMIDTAVGGKAVAAVVEQERFSADLAMSGTLAIFTETHLALGEFTDVRDDDLGWMHEDGAISLRVVARSQLIALRTNVDRSRHAEAGRVELLVPRARVLAQYAGLDKEVVVIDSPRRTSTDESVQLYWSLLDDLTAQGS